MATFNSDHFFSAVKRKSVSEILAVAFEVAGENEAAEIAKQTTRMTDAAIRKMRDALSPDTTEEEIGQVEEAPEELTYADNAAEAYQELIKLEKKVRKAIDAGDKKKAKKALKKLKAHGLGGSEMEKLTNEVKGL